MRTSAMLRSISTAITLLLLSSSSPSYALPQQGEVRLAELFGRQAACPSPSQACGWSNQLCCPSGGCYTDINNQAQCRTAGATVATAATAAGSYSMVTTTIIGTGPFTVTSTYSTFIGATATAVTPASAGCNYALNESPCGSICCASTQFCFVSGECRALGGGSSGYYSSFYSTMYATTNSAGVPLRPTSSTLIIVTAGPSTTASSTVVSGITQPFQTPVATGANVTVTQAQASTGGGGLTGGAIAGIVIGVLLGLFLLGLICFYCCLKGLLDGCMALFGLGRKKQRKEVDEYERYSHHTSGGAAAGRTWYGARKPAKDRRDEKKSSKTKNVLGIGAGLAALWAVLGLKRRNERKKNEEKYSEYSYYSSDYYTSESSASSDRRTRDDRRPPPRR